MPTVCVQEAAPYKQDPEVLAMTNLVAAYQANDILGFEKILRTNRRGAPPRRPARLLLHALRMALTRTRV